MNKLREIFFPCEEEVHRIQELSKTIYAEAIREKHCIACIHYSYDDTIPGFVTYEGDCNLGHTPFFGKRPIEECKDWCEKKAIIDKRRPLARVAYSSGNDGRDDFYYIAYSCPNCYRSIRGYRSDNACDQCGTFYDWGDSEPEIEISRSIRW